MTMPLSALARALGALPSDGLGWCVGFNLGPLRRIAEPTLLAAMFHLDAPPAEEFVAIILADERRLLVDATGDAHDLDGTRLRAQTAAASLAESFAEPLMLAGWHEADVIGLGLTADGGQVVMSGVIHDHDRLDAQAILPARPEPEPRMHLLAGAGVTWLGGEPAGTRWRLRFRNRLTRHLEAGRCARFARTALCNDWFLRGCRMQPDQEQGLLRAAHDRIAALREAAIAQAAALAVDARRDPPRCMTCLPPAPGAPHPYGDLVPLGLLRAGLAAWRGRHVRAQAAAELLARHLRARRQGALWSFETGGLPTATDSALILLGLPDAEGVAALDGFKDPTDPAALLPQRCGAAGPGVMAPDDDNFHWCLSDYATTALARALRLRHGLPPVTPLDWLETGLATRHGLFLANPFLVDLCVARAMPEVEASGLRQRLANEILAARNPDGSFGRFDTILSTASAVAALGALGVAPGAVHRGQLALADLWLDQQGWGEATPFCSTLRDDVADGRGVRHQVTLYADSFRAVTLGLVLMALAEAGDPQGEGADPAGAAGLPAACYRHRGAAAYVVGHMVPEVERRMAAPPA
jgi:hypothetical protein